MELFKISENVERTYVDGQMSENVQSVTYKVMDGDNEVGSASIANGYFSLNAYLPGTIGEIKAKIEEIFKPN